MSIPVLSIKNAVRVKVSDLQRGDVIPDGIVQEVREPGNYVEVVLSGGPSLHAALNEHVDVLARIDYSI